MAAPRVFTAQHLEEGVAVELEAGPSRHLAGALRLRTGDSITLFNGGGGEFPATITALSRKSVTATPAQRVLRERESPLDIHLGIAVSRGDRFDWVVQKSTELGVARITPLLSERTEVKLKGERAEKKLHHWRQVAISACEQCGRNLLPDLRPTIPLTDWTQQVQAECKLVLHHRAGPGEQFATQPASLALLVGPEGGLSPSEIELAEGQGFGALSLGPRVLRTETAPLAAIAILQARWGDMNLE